MKRVIHFIIWPVILLPAIYFAMVWNKLPEKVVMQYGLQGEPSRYGDKTELLVLNIFLVVLNIGMFLLISNAYRLDPKKFAAENKERLQRMAFIISIFIAAIQMVIIYSTLKSQLTFNLNYVYAGVGLLFAAIGNYMPNLKPNYFAGFRVPWTLENEDIWRKTHQLAGKLWFAGGLLIAVVCLFTPTLFASIFFGAVLLTIMIIPGVFSYKLYKKQKIEA